MSAKGLGITLHEDVPPNKAMLCARKEGEPKAWVRRKG
jgi:hypothetical protein